MLKHVFYVQVYIISYDKNMTPGSKIANIYYLTLYHNDREAKGNYIFSYYKLAEPSLEAKNIDITKTIYIYNISNTLVLF
jgi:hypothetical protein